MKKTSLPRAPVCQPITLSVKAPPDSEPAYQSVKAESIRTSPETSVSSSPNPQYLPRSGGS